MTSCSLLLPELSDSSTKRKGLELSRPLKTGSETAPRDETSITPPFSRGQVTFVGRLSSPLAPTEPALRKRSVDPEDSNPHLRPSRGAVFPLRHGPEETLQVGLRESMFSYHTLNKHFPNGKSE